MSSQFDAIFAPTGTGPVRAAIVRALQAGVRAAAESYEFGRPRTDAHTYGNDLWRFVWYEMGQELGALPGAAVRHPRGSFLVDLGHAVLYPFRYGSSWSDDVTVCRLADSQFRRDLLVDPRTELHLFWPQVVLLPYAANPQDGLLRAYAGGARVHDGDLLEWQWLEELELELGAVPAARRGHETVPAPGRNRPAQPQLMPTLADAQEGVGEAG